VAGPACALNNDDVFITGGSPRYGYGKKKRVGPHCAGEWTVAGLVFFCGDLKFSSTAGQFPHSTRSVPLDGHGVGVIGAGLPHGSTVTVRFAAILIERLNLNWMDVAGQAMAR